MNKMNLVLGDWSDDGHGKTTNVTVEVNKTVVEVQEAYKASCKLTGISFNHNVDYTEKKRDWKEAKKYMVCTKYEENTLTNEVKEVLKRFNCPEDIIENFDEECFENFVKLWFWFVKLSLPDLVYTEIKNDIPTINGYWNENLNVAFGYGLFN